MAKKDTTISVETLKQIQKDWGKIYKSATGAAAPKETFMQFYGNPETYVFSEPADYAVNFVVNVNLTKFSANPLMTKILGLAKNATLNGVNNKEANILVDISLADFVKFVTKNTEVVDA
jgi:hypothetical protein